MLPYMIRINPAGFAVLTLILICIYFLYSSTFSSSSIKREISNHHKIDHLLEIVDSINLKELLIASVLAAEKGGREVVKVRQATNLDVQSKGKTKEGANDPLTEGDLKSHWAMVHGLSATFPGLRIISEEEHSSTVDKEVEINVMHVTKGLAWSKKFLSKLRFLDLSEGVEFGHVSNEITVPLSQLTVWIDPLDATQEFTENLKQYVTTMVCIARDGKPIIGIIHKPFEKITYWSWMGQGISPSLQKEITQMNEIPSTNHSEQLKIIVSRSHSGDVESVAKNAFGKDIKVLPAGGAGYKIIEVIKNNVDLYVHTTVIKKWDICAANAMMNSIEGGRLTTLEGEEITYGFDDSARNERGVLASVGKDHAKFVSVLKSAILKKTTE